MATMIKGHAEVRGLSPAAPAALPGTLPCFGLAAGATIVVSGAVATLGKA
jgi:hypothetical protein